MTEWRKVSVAPAYEVSEDGQIRRRVRAATRFAGHRPRGSMKGGYKCYKLATPRGKETHWAHRLVAAAFIGCQPSPKHMIAHGDGDRLNNHYSNLRWALHAENCADTAKHGSLKGLNNPRARIRPDQVLWARREHERGRSISSIARELALSHTSTSYAISGKNWGWLHG